MVSAGQQRVAEVTLPAKATSPARARRFVGTTLAAWGLDDGDDLVLVASELTTNALLHARTPMRVRLAEEAEGIRLSVRDGSGQQPRGRDFSVESGTGRGLLLLESLAAEWGVEPHDDGKTVWCRIVLGGDGAFADFDVDAVEAL
jgi:anti-sigma regulatory factor (Ser/Thr protein kinase)